MTENLVELVERSGIYTYNRGDKIKQIAETADKAACDIASTNGVLTNALDDSGITENAAIIYKPLARRINKNRSPL
ncbi:hypothetical protein J4207_02250 [Candidatus Woesearchaeota archaeon]|nr:hypothetical protein [Candidatus Woesearchaeota archaeon]